jgi:hypothetical protein
MKKRTSNPPFPAPENRIWETDLKSVSPRTLKLFFHPGDAYFLLQIATLSDDAGYQTGINDVVSSIIVIWMTEMYPPGKQKHKEDGT